MKNEQRKKEDCQLLDEAFYKYHQQKLSLFDYDNGFLNKFKADNDLLPNDKWNKWLTYKGESRYMSFFDKEKDIVYGTDIIGNWFCSERKGRPEGYDIATTEEATERLAKIATEMGFVEGVEIDNSNITKKFSIGNVWTCQYSGFYLCDDGSLNFGGAKIMKDGKWAKIIPSDNKIKKLEEKERRLENKLENTRKKLNELKGE